MLEWVAGFVEQAGYVGVAVLMFAENLFPPIPSELVMPLAGFVAAGGDVSLAGVILAGSLGSVAGAMFWYGVGRWVGCDRLRRWTARHGRWLTLAPQDVDKAQDWFQRHGGTAVLMGRLVPTVRTLISVPAGIAGMPLGPFLAYSTIGTALWTAFLAVGGYLLQESYGQVSAWLNPASSAILVVLLMGYVYRVVTFQPRGGRQGDHAR